MSYTLNWTDPVLKPTSIVVASGVIDTTSTSIILNGKGKVNWGQTLQENFLYLLENFASGNGNAPANATLGQLWYDANKKHLNINGLNLNSSGTSFQELAYRRIDLASPPILISYPGDTWYDTTNKYLNVYQSSWSRLAYASQTMGNYSVEVIGSAANAYKVEIDPPLTVLTGYISNFVGRFKVTNPNTSASTIDAGAGPVQLVNSTGGALAVGDLQAGQIISYIYILTDNKAYVTSGLLSQTQGVYAALNGSTSQPFSTSTLTVSGQLTSTVSSGTAPFIVSSTTPVANLSIGGNSATSSHASYSDQLSIVSSSSNNAYYPTFASNAGVSTVYMNAGLTFNPSTNNLSTTTFTGNLSGNVSGSSVSSVSGSFSGLVTAPNLMGQGQTLQNVTGSRTFITGYLNNTGRTIQVLVTIQFATGPGGNGAYLTVDGNIVSDFEMNAYSTKFTLSALVPNGSTYSVTDHLTNGGTSSIVRWFEYR